MIIGWIVLAVILIFGFVIAYGAPYLPTHKKQIETALNLLELKPGQTMLELGCGDGRVAKRAAMRGIKVIAYELNPILVLLAKASNYRYRGQVNIRWANYWAVKWPTTDAVFVFLLDKYMKQLDKKITQTYKGKPIKLVSYAFKIPDKKYTKAANGLYLYIY